MICAAGKKTEKPDLYEVDHIYPGSENNSHIAVLYAELGTSEFSNMNKVMQDLAEKNLISYVFRHYVKVSQLFKFSVTIS